MPTQRVRACSAAREWGPDTASKCENDLVGDGSDSAERGGAGGSSSIEELLDRAVEAINRGDRVAAEALATEVLAADGEHLEAGDLLTPPADGGQIRRLTMLYAELADSMELSARMRAEPYARLMIDFRDLVVGVVNRFGGHIGSPVGASMLAVFGHPTAHEDDARRAVAAALQISHHAADAGADSRIRVRIGLHRGLVYLDTNQDDVYGLGANVAARVAGLAPPDGVVLSDSLAPLVRNHFDLIECAPARVKGIGTPLRHHRVRNERSAPVRSPRGPLVGRRHEVGRLARAWAQAEAGHAPSPGLVLRAEAGLGKSRLAAEAADLAARSGAAVLEIAGSSAHTTAGLHPIRRMLLQHCDIGRSTSDSERLRRLRVAVSERGLDPDTSIPLLAPVLGIAAAAGYQPAAAEGPRLHAMIIGAVRDYLRARIGDRAGLIVAEDAHWFDPSTLELVASLLDDPDHRLLVLITGRPGAWLSPQWPVTVLDLAPLNGADSEALVGELDPGLSTSQREEVAARCDGVPFFIEQVVSGMSETGVPEGLYEPLLARLRASTDVVPVVEAAALIGRQLDRELLQTVADLTEERFTEALDELVDARVLEPSGGGGWRFRHELLRELAEELAPPSVRRRLHARIAAALTGGRTGDPQWPAVADHYERAENPAEAAAAFRKAATQARRRGALQEALDHLTRALTNTTRQPVGRCRDLAEMGTRLERGFLASAGEGPLNATTATDFERCLQLVGTELHDEVFSTLAALGGYYFAIGDLPRSNRVWTPLWTRLGEGREYFRPILGVTAGIAAWMAGDFVSGRDQILSATEEFALTGTRSVEQLWFNPTDSITMAHGILALDRIAAGDLPGAEDHLLRSARRADELTFPQGPFSLGFARFFETWVRLEAGQLDRAAAVTGELLAHAEKFNFEVWALWGHALRIVAEATTELTAGPASPALTEHASRLAEAVDLLHTAGLRVFLPLFEAAAARLLTAAGEPELAGTRLDRALRASGTAGMTFYDAELLRLRAHTATSDPGADLSAAAALARCQGAALFELRAVLDTVDGHSTLDSPLDSPLDTADLAVALTTALGRLPAGCPLPEVSRSRARGSPPEDG